jgi:hypothetical protein
MSQEDAQQSATSTAGPSEAVEEPENAKIQTADWEESKRQGAILLKVQLTNKSQDKDLKVWYRLTPGQQGEAGLNVTLPASMRKTYLNTKTQKVIELLVKIDPSKPYFFQSMENIKVEIEATVRNTSMGLQDRGNAGRRVHYAVQHTASVGTGTQSN